MIAIKRRRLVTLALALALLSPSGARASHSQESIFQDDDHLIYTGTRTVERTLGELQGLGVQRVRITVEWAAIAPAAQSRWAPRGFNPSDPAAYSQAAWSPYDRIVSLAARYGIAVDFDVTAPGPLWAMGSHPPSARAANHWKPDPYQFFLFVEAVGSRYSGTYRTAAGFTLPRVDYFSIWNEPNQPGWLAPQWQRLHGRVVMFAPQLYREYVQAATVALYLTGHFGARDHLLIGELAPEGYTTPGVYKATTPMPFLRALYCVDGRYRPLRGSAAEALGCPRSSAKQFVDNNVGLFYSSGFAHHPYYFYHPPNTSSSDPNIVPVGNLSRLERGLDRVFGAYGVRRRLPLYLTEYGYQTNPPDPYQVVSPAQQAVYLNEAEFMAWRDQRVRSVAQYELYDAAPDNRYQPSDPKYWDTFQMGLRFLHGTAKPSLFAYRIPVWIPHPHVGRRGSVLIWGDLRPAWWAPSARGLIQWRPEHGHFRTIAALSTSGHRGYLEARVRPPASGVIRLAMRGFNGRLQSSRGVEVTLG